MFKKIIIYGIGTFFSKLLVFLMIPVYTRVLSPSEYGYYDVLLSNVQLVATIAFMEVWSGIIRFMFDDKDVYSPVKTFINLLPLFLLLYVVFFFLFSHFFVVRFFWIAFFYGISYLFFSTMNSICRGLGRNVDYIISGAISSVVSCGLNFVFLVFFHKSIGSMFIALIIGYLCGIMYVELRTHALIIAIKKSNNWAKMKEMLVYCFPLMINTFSYSFLSVFNKNLIMGRLGETSSGYYAVAEKVSVILSVLISIYQLAWQEEAYAFAKSENKNEIYSYYLNQFIKCIGLLVPIYMLVCYFAMPIISGAKFNESLKLIPLFVIQVYIGSISSLLCIIISANKKSMQILFSMVLGAIVNTSLVGFLIPKFGVLASNISLCIGLSVCALARYFFARQFAVLKVNLMWFCVVFISFVFTYILFQINNSFLVFVSLMFLVMVWFIVNSKEIKGYIEKIFCRYGKK